MTDSLAPHDGTSVDLGTTVMTALRLVATQRPADAVDLLAFAMANPDPTCHPADPALIDASTLYATLTTGIEQLRAARHAYRASNMLYPCGHPRRLAAASAYGTALHEHGHLDTAIAVRRRLLAGYRSHQPQNALPASVGFAASLHAAGRCDQAVTTVRGAWNIWRHHPHGDLSTGTIILDAVIRMLRSCRRDLDLIALISQARATAAWDNLVITHTAAAAAAQTAYIDAHRSTVCAHAQQPRAGASAVPAPRQPPPAAPRLAPRAPADAWSAADRRARDSPRPHPPDGSPAANSVASARRLPTAAATAADVVCHADRVPHAGANVTRQQLIKTTAALIRRQGRRTTLPIAAILLPTTTLVALVLHVIT